jgi:hypothetical protein
VVSVLYLQPKKIANIEEKNLFVHLGCPKAHHYKGIKEIRKRGPHVHKGLK